MATKKYWKGLEELNNSPEFVQKASNEFAEQIPVEALLSDENIAKAGTNRRDFLKFLGFSVTAASLASCETPVYKAIPYINKPEEITPGVANWYASTYYDGADYAAILVKTREGRPIKIAGNNLSEVSLGGTNSRIQASVLSLYDSSRLKNPVKKEKYLEWAAIDAEIIQKLSVINAKGGAIRLLTSTIISPSTQSVINDFIAKYPTTKQVVYDAISYDAISKAHQQTHGKRVIPSYKFENANVIVSVAADFLGNWVADYSVQYGKNRKVKPGQTAMSKHYQFEANMSLTGANADERTPVKVSELGKVVLNLYNAVAKSSGGNAVNAGALPHDAKINKVAQELAANKGKALVVCGVNDVYVQVLVNELNNLLGAYGSTIDVENANLTHQGNDAAFVELINEMQAGKVDAIITYNTNPVYTAPASLKFADAYRKAGLRISFADRIDETAAYADYICPDHHYLESWNDYNPIKSHYSLSQPTISPLFDTRQAQHSLLKWCGNLMDYHNYMQKLWKEKMFPQSGTASFPEFWNKCLHDGVAKINAAVIEPAALATVAPAEKIDASAAAQKVNSVKTSAIELNLYQKNATGNGSMANNPYLQEMPDPITKITWDNYVTMSPIDMKGKYKLMERQDREASVVNVTANGVTVKLPVIPQPGQAAGTIGIAVGYGREKAGSLSQKCGVIGKNAYPFVQYLNGTMQYTVTDVQVASANETMEMAGTQVHHTIMGRDLLRETTLAEYKENPQSGNHVHTLETHSGTKPTTAIDLWDEFDRPGHKWGLTIDLNSCYGCGACVVSCSVENNVAVVGRSEVMKTREMHWLRIDRYYSSDMTKQKAETENKGAIDMYLEMENPAVANPKVVFQPVMCQHCNHAPCESVCPVLATNHSNDGLNMMTYNRCVGTRYCANNCPFKVRRFNWFNYGENKDFSFNPTQDDIGRMVLNPDVVVRSRGVMEKCSMCIQRIQAGKLQAKSENRKLKDEDITIACAESCPTNAIIFGDLNDENSAVSKFRKEQKDRNYFMLEEFGVKPTVSYLTKVRNSNESFSDGDHEDHKHHGNKTHGHPANNDGQPHGQQHKEKEHA